MRAGLSLVATVVFLTACSARPPDAYPIFRPEQEAPISTVSAGEGRLIKHGERYLDRADQAQRALYEQSDWTLAGVIVGVTGGLIGNVATAATGAGIAAGASQLPLRYHLAAQRAYFDSAANKTNCVLTVIAAVRDSAPASLSDALDRLPDLVRAINFAITGIQTQLRSELNSLAPATIDAASLLAAYASYYQISGTKVPPPSSPNTKPASGPNEQDKRREFAIQVLVKTVQLALLDIESCVKTGVPVSPVPAAVSSASLPTAPSNNEAIADWLRMHSSPGSANDGATR